MFLTIVVTLLLSIGIILLIFLGVKRYITYRRKHTAQKNYQTPRAISSSEIEKIGLMTYPIYAELMNPNRLAQDLYEPRLRKLELRAKEYKDIIEEHRSRVREEIQNAREIIQEHEDLTDLTRVDLAQTLVDMSRETKLSEAIDELLKSEAEELRSQRSRRESDDSDEDTTRES